MPGIAPPRGIPRGLDRDVWDADAGRDDLRTWVATELGDPAGILVIDEPGFPNQGRHSVGVQRQDCGTRGKIANCQIGVFLGYTSPQGYAASDRATLRAPDLAGRSGPRSPGGDPAAAGAADQTPARPDDAGTGAGCGRAGRLGRWRRRLWQRGGAAAGAGSPGTGLRARRPPH